MNQKGFAKIVVVIIVLAGAVGYFAFVKKTPSTAQQTGLLYGRVLGATTPEPPRSYIDSTLPASAATCTVNVSAGGDLQAAIDNAKLGDTICLQAGATFTGKFILKKKTTGTGWITIRTSTPDAQFIQPGTRVSPSDVSLMPKLKSVADMDGEPVFKTEFGAHHYRLIGLEIIPPTTAETANLSSSYTYQSYGLIWFGTAYETALSDLPNNLIIDRSYIHGWPDQEVRRGVNLNSANAAVIDSYISEIHQLYSDTQAIGGWSGSGPFKIYNNYLESAGENVLFGGGRPSIVGNVTSDVEFRKNHISKPLSWRSGGSSFNGNKWLVKTPFEMKSVRRLWVEGNVFDTHWEGVHSGHMISIWPTRPQSGEWAVVEDIIIENNIIKDTATAISLAGTGLPAPDNGLNRVLIRNNLIYDMGGSWGGSGGAFRGFTATNDVRIEHNTLINEGANRFLDLECGKISTIPPFNTPDLNFEFVNNIVFMNGPGTFASDIWPGLGYQITKYDNPWRGDLNDYSALGTCTSGSESLDTRFTKNVMINNQNYRINITRAEATSDYEYIWSLMMPQGNFYPSSAQNVGFTNFAGKDFKLTSFSLYKNAGTDGKDIGADIDLVLAATAGAVSGVTGVSPPTPISTPTPTLTPTPTPTPIITPTPTSTPTLTPTPTPTPIPTPLTNLVASCSSSGTTVTLSWNPSSAATYYALRVDNQSDGWTGTCSSSTDDFCLNTTSTTYSFSPRSGATYSWWVHAVNTGGWSVQASGPNFTCFVPTPTPTPTPLLTPTPTPTFTSIPTPTRTPTPTPTPTLTPTPTPTPIPTPTPSPSTTPIPTSPAKLIRFSDNPKVYEVTEENQIKWIPSITVFNQLNLDWKNVTVEPPSKAPQYQRVKLMRAEGDTKVYYITEKGFKRHIPSADTFLSYGNKWSDVAAVQSFELSGIPDNILIRVEGRPEVYKLENGAKRWIKTAEAFNRLGYKWSEIAPVNSIEIENYPIGATIE